MTLENKLGLIDKMPQSNFDEIVEKYVEMNIATPFVINLVHKSKILMYKNHIS